MHVVMFVTQGDPNALMRDIEAEFNLRGLPYTAGDVDLGNHPDMAMAKAVVIAFTRLLEVERSR